MKKTKQNLEIASVLSISKAIIINTEAKVTITQYRESEPNSSEKEANSGYRLCNFQSSGKACLAYISRWVCTPLISMVITVFY